MIFSELDLRQSTPLVLTIPGLGNSGPTHWQSIWERTRGDCQRADLGMWDAPRRNPWVTTLAQTISGAQPPIVLVAHSLGCIAVAWWAAFDPQPFGYPVAGALLVAPPDDEALAKMPELAEFGPVPRLSLPFPSILVASSDDPYADIGRSHDMAKYWGSHFLDIGPCGHINAESGLGGWRQGEALLDGLIDRVSGPVERNATLSQAEWASVRAEAMAQI
jgi:predicted alpha/beta hydrolase family esterase